MKYGYCAVGTVEAGPKELVGRTVFCLHPHQDVFQAPAAMAVPLPDGLPPRRATLAANMETALNALWDSGAGPADRIVVVGAGIVGLLVAYLAARLPGAEVTVIDPVEARRALVGGIRREFLPLAPSGSTRRSALTRRPARRGRQRRRRVPHLGERGGPGDGDRGGRHGRHHRRAVVVRRQADRGAARRRVPQPAAAS